MKTDAAVGENFDPAVADSARGGAVDVEMDVAEVQPLAVPRPDEESSYNLSTVVLRPDDCAVLVILEARVATDLPGGRVSGTGEHSAVQVDGRGRSVCGDDRGHPSTISSSSADDVG